MPRKIRDPLAIEMKGVKAGAFIELPAPGGSRAMVKAPEDGIYFWNLTTSWFIDSRSLYEELDKVLDL